MELWIILVDVNEESTLWIAGESTGFSPILQCCVNILDPAIIRAVMTSASLEAKLSLE